MSSQLVIAKALRCVPRSKKSMKVLITGGAGFIGTKLSTEMLKAGWEVNVLDNFSGQVHADNVLDKHLSEHVNLFIGDVRDKGLLEKAVNGCQCVIHLAAETGTGQSMYEIDRYFSVNVQGTAGLIDVISSKKQAASVDSLIVASSRAVYGEGAYSCADHGTVFPDSRDSAAMERGQFELTCPVCRKHVKSIPTCETAPVNPSSYYGLTKQFQEQAVLMAAKRLGLKGVAVRCQNVYGPGQSLKNPYTGILAIFSNLLRQECPIDIYEDGLESRDFVYVDDVVESIQGLVQMESDFVGAVNIGSGVATSVIDVATTIKAWLKSSSDIGVTGQFRVGDIRHNTASLDLLRTLTSDVPKTSFEDGINEFLTWAVTQPFHDKLAYKRSVEELSARGLFKK